MPRPTAIDAARRFRQRLLSQEAEAAERMARAYARIGQSMQDDIDALADEIAAMEEPEPSKLYRLGRLQRLLEQARQQVTRFGGVVRNEVDVISSRAIEQGTQDALALIDASLPELAPELRARLRASFTTLPAEAIESAVGLLEPDSPLVTRLEEAYGEYVAGSVQDHLVTGIAKGQNPRRIAMLLTRNLTQGLGPGLTSALTTIRTAQIKSYQTANHMIYAANNRIVPEWIWSATLDSRTCMSCVAQHGKAFPYTERLNDHHRGRCSPIPRTITYRDLGINLPDPVPPFPTGEEWFRQQPAATQREMMGPGMYEAWQADQFAFEDLSVRYDDAVYGELLREATLRELTR